MDIESRRGPADRIRPCLEAGGEACAEMITDVLEHAMEVLEGLSVSSPRKSRKGLLETMEHVESHLETVVDVGWCDGVCWCGPDELEQLCSLLVSVRGLASSSGVPETSDAVTALLECLDRCGSVVVQSIAVLSGGSDASDSSSVLSALESLRGLSNERLDGVSADEAAAYDAVLGHVSGMDACAGGEVVSSCMALHTLGCRNGIAVCGRVDVLELAGGVLCRIKPTRRRPSRPSQRRKALGWAYASPFGERSGASTIKLTPAVCVLARSFVQVTKPMVETSQAGTYNVRIHTRARTRLPLRWRH
eukprot:COSAG06_NODE_10174_length_1735_cov_2.826406_4_plen_305_part_01